jgi:hypothetical protein
MFVVKNQYGFVSNSSSSSFIIIMTEEDFKKLYDEVDSYQKEVISLLVDSQKFNGQVVKVISGISGNYSSFEDMSIDVESEEWDCPDTAFDAIKFPETALRFNVDM